jgi:tRNA(Ile2) C34 agmatinyltransferase TiaS
MKCPKCNIEMQPTYEPYELRCPKCGYWWDTYTGKEIKPFSDIEMMSEAEYKRLHQNEWIPPEIDSE